MSNKDYHKQKSKDHYRRYKQKYLDRNAKQRQDHWEFVGLVKGHYGCVCCSEREIVCLEFHHLDPLQKDIQIGSQRHLSSRVIEELSKCIVVCANCHKKIHAGLIVAPNEFAIVVTEVFLNNAG